MSDAAMRPAPGWYADPKDATRARWWNGAGWSETTRPLPGAASSHPESTPGYAGAPAPAQPVQPARPTEPISPYATNTPAAPASPHPDLPSSPAAWSRDPAQRSLASGYAAMSGYVPEVAGVGSPNTVPGWFMATAPLWSNVIAFGVGVLLSTAGVAIDRIPTVAWLIPSVMAMVALAIGDAHVLRSRGYSPPHPATTIPLAPWIYLGLRGKEVRRKGRRMWPMELTFALCFLLSLVMAFGALVLDSSLTRMQSARAESVRATVERDLARQAGVNVTLTCTAAADEYVPGATIDCTASAVGQSPAPVHIAIAGNGDVSYVVG